MPPHPTIRVTQSRRTRQKGFALVIALMLMSFMLLLLISLGSLTAVETTTSANDNLQMQARANARTALLLALGELQYTAGPDQRTTAAAAMGLVENSVGPDSSRASGHGLVPPVPGALYWTGVWGTATAPGDHTGNSDAVLLNWLVSGNENIGVIATGAEGNLSFSTAKSANYKPDGSGGQALPAPSANDKPTDHFNGWSLLVAGGSVDTARDHVFAPLVKIGNDTAGNAGRYSWWVGDEGVKARLDLRDSLADRRGVTPDLPSLIADDGRSRVALARRSGIERLGGLADYPVNHEVLDHIYSVEALPNVMPTASTAVMRQQFHHLTAYSNGVLANARKGGLREDLSFYLEGSASPAEPLMPSIAGDSNFLRNEGPTWDVLRSFYNQLKNNSGGATTPVTPVAATASQHGINPVVVQMRNSMRIFVNASGGTEIHLRPVLVLGNPYNVPLSIDGLDVRYHTDENDRRLPTIPGGENTARLRHRLELATDIANSTAEISTWNGVVNQAEVARSTGEPRFQVLFFNPNEEESGLQRSIFTNTVFRIPAFTLPAGGVMVFGLSDSINLPDDNRVAVVNLAEGTPSPSASLRIPVRNHSLYNHSGYYMGQDAGGFIPATSLGTLPDFGPPFVGPIPNTWSMRTIGSGHFNLSVFPLGEGEMENPWSAMPLMRLSKVGTLSNRPSRTFDGAMAFGTYPTAPVITRYSLELPGNTSSQRSSYAHFNIRGQNVWRPGSYHTTSSSQQNPLIPNSVITNDSDFLKDLDRWGSTTAASGMAQASLFNLKGISRETPMLSLGAFQHADLSVGQPGRSISTQPGNAFGNSLASPHVTRDSVRTASNVGGYNETYYDSSYILNQALWDGYFFSTIAQTGADPLPTVLPNNRTIPLTDDLDLLRDGNSAAAHLLLLGAFNVNSVSTDAWKAVLSSMRFNAPAADGGEPVAYFLRSLDQPGSAAISEVNRYRGYRVLSDDQVDALATEIVKQVRQRGPFVNLSSFVNRRLIDSPNSGGSFDAAETAASVLGLKGALQAAIDATGSINTVVTSATEEIKTTTSNHERFSYGSGDTNALLGNKHAGTPGWLTQADILQALGPVLSSRSDTFIIRAYGDVVDPATIDSAEPRVLARAWCEAVVQRLPQPVEPDPANLYEPASHEWGRRFHLVNFRWLAADEI